jgi:transmembrane sensor
VKYLLHEASGEEQQQVEAWIAEDALHLAHYSQLQKVWETSKQIATQSTRSENEAWDRFRQQLSGRVAPARRNPLKWLKIAASILVMAGLGWLGYTLFYTKPVKEILVQAQQTVRNDTLPDGSVVTLNKKSSIRHLSAFNGKTRAVALEGEAFFNITPNKEKPFVIAVKDVEVTVVGTSFNINSNGGKTEIVVETGIVKVKRGTEEIELHAGEKLSINSGNVLLTKERVTDKLYNYYRTKEFVCDDTPLWKLIAVVKEAYNVNIVLANKEAGNQKINATFYNESLDQVLDVIALTFNLKITKTNNQVILQ